MGFDIVLFGATGFTGKLVAAYLAKHTQPPASALKWALAGRSLRALEAVRATLSPPWNADLPLIVVDAHDQGALDAMVAQTRVVLSTVGPFWQHGELLVATCAQRGVHYADITGEFPWVRELVTKYHATAAASGAKILNCCGFDSLPSEYGVLLCQKISLARYGAPMSRVTCHVGPLRSAPSGGTLHTMLHMFSQPWRELLPMLQAADSHYLVDNVPPSAHRRRPQQFVWYDAATKRLTAPWVMATGNMACVQRGNALLHWAYGPSFEYTECMSFALTLTNVVVQTALALVMPFAVLLLLFDWVRVLVRCLLPSPGAGPSAARMARGLLRMNFFASSTASQHRVHVQCQADFDVAYAGTAVMLAETGLCLALGDIADNCATAGVLTPASAVGDTLLPRLERSGIRFVEL